MDPEPEAAFTAWAEAYADIQHQQRPDTPGWSALELRTDLRRADGVTRTVGLALTEGSDPTVLGVATVELPQMDNPHLAIVYVGVRPEVRRRGGGTLLLEAAEAEAARAGRRVVAGWLDEPLNQAGRSSGRALAAARGYDQVQTNPRRDLFLPLEDGRLEALRAEAEPFAADYEVVAWVGPWPEANLADRAEMGRRMSTDPPAGGFDLAEEVWDASRVLRGEAYRQAQERDGYVAAARHRASGTMVAFTEVEVPRDAPEHAWQHDTLVLPEHRGHRLGTLVKLANLELLARRSPATRRITTYNAAENDPMVSVNEALGCLVVGLGSTWQRSL